MFDSLSEFKPLAAIATTPQSAQTLQPLVASGVTLWLPNSLAIDWASTYSGSLQQHLTNIWSEYRGFVFALAAGAVVRLIAPLLRDKATDPAVVVVDCLGKYAVSLCSGHQGGADLLATIVAQQLEATPIITGATAALNLPAIDTIGFRFGWRKGAGDWTGVMSALARQQPVQVVQQAGSTLHRRLLSSPPFDFEASTTPAAKIVIGAKVQPSESHIPQVQWHPRVLWIGIGCERHTPYRVIEAAINTVCQRFELAIASVAKVATIDLKADEAGILEFCQRQGLPLQTFSAAELNCVAVPTPSKVVAQEVGTSSVAEAAAILASGGDNLIVPKQIFRLEGEPGAVTVAIAQSDLEYSDRTGKLLLVGTGPGSLAQITPAAKGAIMAADVVIGYSLYLDLIQPLFTPSHIVEASPITQEQQRGQKAIELAQRGLTVAVVSSGDCGIYGMAGLVLQQLQHLGWDGKIPAVEVIPGISALQASAARVGAPLMHDFCAISLSDLLTPWGVIVQRLEAAARADFVVSLYNPRSRTRTGQIITAQQIFLQYRLPSTPVAVVKSVYRQGEQIYLTTLAQMLDTPIDMLTTVIIGNSNTRNYGGWLITPRGYEIESQ